MLRYSIKKFPIQIYGNLTIIFNYPEECLTHVCFNEYIDSSEQIDSHTFFRIKKYLFLNELDCFN